MMSTDELKALATNLRKAQAKLAAAEKRLKPTKDLVNELEEKMLAAMLAANLEQVAIKQATFAVRRTDVAELVDDKAFFAYVAKKKAWDLVRKQVNVGAARLRWEDKLTIPGVRHATRVGLSTTPRRAK